MILKGTAGAGKTPPNRMYFLFQKRDLLILIVAHEYIRRNVENSLCFTINEKKKRLVKLHEHGDVAKPRETAARYTTNIYPI